MRSIALGLSALALCACHDRSIEPKADGGEVVKLAAQDVSPPLRQLAKLPHVGRSDSDEPEESEPARQIPHPHWRKAAEMPAIDAVTQLAFGPAAIPAPTVNFEGMGAGMSGFTPGGIPPDTDGDVGPNHYVQVVNVSLSVFSRTGTMVMGPMDTGNVWSGFNGACGQSNDGDATVRYDHIADRWVISQFSIGGGSGPFYQCVAVSTTPDPTGTYARYQFNYDAMNDYPKISLWPDAYYFTFNMFPNSGFAGGKVCAMDRTKMLAGDPNATMQCFDAGSNYGGLLTSDLDGKTLPPANAPAGVIALDSNTDLAYWQLHVDWATPSNSTFTGPQSITVSSYSALCDGGTCVTEPSGGVQLDSLADRAMNRFVYRRFADHESMLLSHSVTSGSGGGIRWYELRNAASPTVYQQGTYAPDSTIRWLPSIAMDASGDIATVYTVSSSTVNPGIRYAAHASTDPLGTMGLGEGTIVTGGSVQTQVSRWGDYSSINIDPVDDCTFWATHEYHKTSGRSNWQTRVAAFSLPNCSAFALTGDAETVQQGATATYTITTQAIAGTPQMLNLSVSGLPAGVTATLNPTSVTAGGTTMVTLTADSSAALGATHYTVAGMGTSSSAMVDVALTITPAPTSGGSDAGTGSNNGNGNPPGGGCCEVSGSGSPFGTALLGIGLAIVVARRRRRA